MEPQIPESLLTGLQQKDPRVISEFYQSFAPVSARYTFRAIGVHPDAHKDILHKAIQVLLAKAPDLVLQPPATVHGYCMGIVKRLTQKFLASQQKTVRWVTLDPQEGMAPIDEAELLRAQDRVRRARELLHHYQTLLPSLRSHGQCADYISAYHLEGYSHQELAERNGITPEAMRQRLSRCMKEWRELIQKTGDI